MTKDQDCGCPGKDPNGSRPPSPPRIPERPCPEPPRIPCPPGDVISALCEVHAATCEAIWQVAATGGTATGSASAAAAGGGAAALTSFAALAAEYAKDVQLFKANLTIIANRVRRLGASGNTDTQGKLAGDVEGEAGQQARCRCIVNPSSGQVECWDPDYNNGKGGFNPNRNHECGLP